ncbi:MAG: NfeD family protein [Gammaproteobacteria bacterium]
MNAIFRKFALLPLLAAHLAFISQGQADEPPAGNASGGTVMLLTVDDAIGPATVNYLEQSLDRAAETGAVCVLIRIDTPGGLDSSMRAIIKKIIASPVPVATYVAPGGARAASAGTYILYASHIAAMAPATNLGAATPVQIAGPEGVEPQKRKPGAGEETGEKTGSSESGSAMEHKMVNDAVAYIRSLARMRGRNADWAEKAVREAASLPAEEALALNVIDLIARNETELLEKIDGRKINILGEDIVLATGSAAVDRVDPDWRNELLTVITNPNIAYILMLIGIYGLILEFYNPGAVVPGTIGGICLLLAMFAFQLLPINYAGMGLILLGIVLMIAESFAPGFGILGLGGVVAFVIGSVILMDSDAPGFRINLGLVGGFALSSAAFFILALGMLLKSRHKPVVSGREELIGAVGVALDDFPAEGPVRIHSEHWLARSDGPVQKNQKVRVNGLDGLVLLVTPVNQKENA